LPLLWGRDLYHHFRGFHDQSRPQSDFHHWQFVRVGSSYRETVRIEGMESHCLDAAISELLKPYDARLMRSYPVSTRINHASNDDADCARPVELAETQDRLFS
jgi:hypothetical protein